MKQKRAVICWKFSATGKIEGFALVFSGSLSAVTWQEWDVRRPRTKQTFHFRLNQANQLLVFRFWRNWCRFE